MDYCEEIHADIAARQYVYGLFQTLFNNDPSEQLFEAVDVAFTKEALDLALPEETYRAEVEEFLQGFSEYSKQLPVLKKDYAAAFVGPHDLPAPPWESVYASGKRLLFQVSTLEIREIYRSQGLLPEQYPHVADDHIALELDFMANLAKRMQDAYVAQNAQALVEARGISASFLEGHLLKWIPSFTDDLATWKQDSWYTLAAKLLVAFIKADQRFLDRLECE